MSAPDPAAPSRALHPSSSIYMPKPSGGKVIGIAIVIILGLGGLAVAGVGLGGHLRVSSLSHLGQVNSIVMMAAGGAGGICFLTVGIVWIVGSVKKRNAHLKALDLIWEVGKALDACPHFETIKQLMQEVKEAQIDIHATYHRGDPLSDCYKPIIHNFITLGLTDILRSLVEEGLVDFDGYHETLGSPLYIACLRYTSTSPEMFQFILEHSPREMLDKAPHGEMGVQAKHMDYTPLCLVIKTNQPEKAQALLDKGANPNIPCKGRYPLHIAVENKNSDIVFSLARAGANIDVKDLRERSPYRLAFDLRFEAVYDCLSLGKMVGKEHKSILFEGPAT